MSSRTLIMLSRDFRSPVSDVERQLIAMNNTLYDKTMLPYEEKIRDMLDFDLNKHAIAQRWPLPELPLIVSLRGGRGDCLIGKMCEVAKQPSKWNTDQHIRDIIISLLLEVALPWGPNTEEPCIVHDVGANIGLIAHTMAKMGCHVIAVEPQVDLCVALRTTLALKGELHKHLVFCGGVGLYPKGRLATSTGLYRYEGRFVFCLISPPLVPFSSFFFFSRCGSSCRSRTVS